MVGTRRQMPAVVEQHARDCVAATRRRREARVAREERVDDVAVLVGFTRAGGIDKAAARADRRGRHGAAWSSASAASAAQVRGLARDHFRSGSRRKRAEARTGRVEQAHSRRRGRTASRTRASRRTTGTGRPARGQRAREKRHARRPGSRPPRATPSGRCPLSHAPDRRQDDGLAAGRARRRPAHVRRADTGGPRHQLCTLVLHPQPLAQRAAAPPERARRAAARRR